MTRVATFNVNGVNGRLPVLLKWLGETDCDVVCLQELKTSDDKFPIEAIRDAGFGAIWHGQKSYNGVAVLARGRDPAERRPLQVVVAHLQRVPFCFARVQHRPRPARP